jgi:hypothetical protein
MKIWWKRLSQGDVIESEAAQFLKVHGDRAYEVARKAARTARNKRDHRQARHYSHLALRISELTKREVELDTATPMAEASPAELTS